MKINDVIRRLLEFVPIYSDKYEVSGKEITNISVNQGEVIITTAEAHGIDSTSTLITTKGIKQQYDGVCTVENSHSFKVNFALGHNFHKGEQTQIESSDGNFYEVIEIQDDNNILLKGQLEGNYSFFKQDQTNFNGVKDITVIDETNFSYQLRFLDVSSLLVYGSYCSLNIYSAANESEAIERATTKLEELDVFYSMFVVIGNGTSSVDNINSSFSSVQRANVSQHIEQSQSLSIYVYGRSSNTRDNINEVNSAVLPIFQSIVDHQFDSFFVKDGYRKKYYGLKPTSNSLVFSVGDGKQYIRRFDFAATVTINHQEDYGKSSEGTKLKEIGVVEPSKDIGTNVVY